MTVAISTRLPRANLREQDKKRGPHITHVAITQEILSCFFWVGPLIWDYTGTAEKGTRVWPGKAHGAA